MSMLVAPICVLDADIGIRHAVENLLRGEGFDVELFTSAETFIARARKAPIACVILDVELPDLSGLELQSRMVTAGLDIPFIFLTASGSVSMSVHAMKAGAVEFLTKPLESNDLIQAVQKIVRPANLQQFEIDNDSEDMVGESPALKAILRRIQMVAPTDSTVLVTGETGVGKECIAKEIHRRSRRSEKPLIRVNCASIPKNLFESEFFGHVKGAFTGAFKDRVGRFEAADGGTLFLDEVGEIPLDLQCKLLRALQEKQYERVGDERTRRSDVRIISATNRNLKEEVAAGRFREDLFYRLNVFPLDVVPLRQRPDDIPLLANHFMRLVVQEMNCPEARLTTAGIASLIRYDWPGNIRELRNVIERAMIVANGGALEFDLPISVTILPPDATPSKPAPSSEFLTEPEMLQRERDNLLVILEITDWKIKGSHGAAELLGIKPTTLLSRIKKMGLTRGTARHHGYMATATSS